MIFSTFVENASRCGWAGIRSLLLTEKRVNKHLPGLKEERNTPDTPVERLLEINCEVRKCGQGLIRKRLDQLD